MLTHDFLARPPDNDEHIEILIKPSDRVDLIEFAKALEALNSEYRQWLREKGEFDHKDRDLRLCIDRIDSGSIRIWISKSKELILPVLERFFKERIGDFLPALSNGTLDPKVPTKTLMNTRAWLRWDTKFSYESKRRKISLETSLEGQGRIDAQNEVAKRLTGKDVVEVPSEAITFVGFHKENNAKVIAETFSPNDVTAYLASDVRDYFLAEDDNFLAPGKKYLVEMEVHFRQQEIEHYFIKSVLGS